MNKKYRLKKDLPGIPAGTENNGWNSGGSPFWYTPQGSRHTLNWFEKYFNDWVEEIQDFSFVKEGDVYTSESTGYFVWIKRNKASGWSYRYRMSELGVTHQLYLHSYLHSYDDRDFKDISNFSDTIKPENLVYRPGEVDKLGWDKPTCNGKEVVIDVKTYVPKEKAL